MIFRKRICKHTTYNNRTNSSNYSINNCVGVDGDKIFAMAYEVGYGIKTVKGELAVDEKII